jgi:pyrroline-5-carboxylate reductase
LMGQMGQVKSLLEAYMSYRGITAAGLEAAERAGFGEALHAALSAATDKAAAMGRDTG